MFAGRVQKKTPWERASSEIRPGNSTNVASAFGPRSSSREQGWFQNLSPLPYLFPSADQNLLKAHVTQDHVKTLVFGSAPQAFRWCLFFPPPSPHPPGQDGKEEPPKHKSFHFANTIRTETASQNRHFGSRKKSRI